MATNWPNSVDTLTLPVMDGAVSTATKAPGQPSRTAKALFTDFRDSIRAVQSDLLTNPRLLAVNNLSDVEDGAAALVNLGYTVPPAYNRIQAAGINRTQQPIADFSTAFQVTNSGTAGAGKTSIDLLPSYRLRSTTPQDITNFTTGNPQAVTGASFTLPTNATATVQEYDLEMRVKYESTGLTGGNDIQMDMSFPTGVTADGGFLGLQSGAQGQTATVNNATLTEATGPRIFGGIGTGGDTALRVFISVTITVPATPTQGSGGGAVTLLAAPNANTDTAPNSTRILSVAGTAIRVT